MGRRNIKWKDCKNVLLGCQLSHSEAATCFVFFCFFHRLLNAHPLSCGHTHHLPTFLTRPPSGFHLTYFLEASPVKAHPKQHFYTQTNTHAPTKTHTHTLTQQNLTFITRHLYFKTANSNKWVNSLHTMQRCVEKKQSLHQLCVLWHHCECTWLFMIRQNALQDTHKGKARVLRGERCSSVSHLSPL